MTTLTDVLDANGYAARPQQVKLYDALRNLESAGEASVLVAQAGTGTGKSIAVLSAAVDAARYYRKPSLVVVPTNVLMRQYITTDAPTVENALGVTIKALQGRNHYLCASAPGFAGLTRLPDEVIDLEPEMNQRLWSGEIHLVQPHGKWFGCPGSDECRGADEDWPCHYRMAKDDLEGADVIVTNAHLLIIDQQLKGLPPVQRETDEGTVMFQPRIFPEYGALFVDEAHTLEDSLRSFATRSIPRSAVEEMRLAGWLTDKQRRYKDSFTVTPDGELVAMLQEISTRPRYDEETGEKLKKHQIEAIEAATYMLQRGKDGAYSSNEAVLWFEPQPYPRQPRLVSTQINMAGAARRLLTLVPTGLVSGTTPRSMRQALGIPDADFLDVGHPFDYGKQATLTISAWSGAFQATKANPENMPRRAEQVRDRVIAAGGGALLLFSSYRDMEFVADLIERPLRLAGLDVRMQTREGDKRELGQWFKDHGNAVLFGTESFATGFDVPGDALRLVCIWKLPYPGLDPVTRAISNRSRQRYEDMMLMKVTQAAGRLVRTVTDTGEIFIADNRASKVLLGRDDPMIAHFNDMAHERRVEREEY